MTGVEGAPAATSSGPAACGVGGLSCLPRTNAGRRLPSSWRSACGCFRVKSS